MDNWVRVEDRNPDNDVDVLAFDARTGEQYVAQVSFGRWAILSGLQVVSDSHDCQPTHWMYLPDPPLR